MNEGLVSSKKKTDKARALSDLQIREMKKKLMDETYVYSAIYRLASILTEQILNSGGIEDEQEQ